MFDVWGCVYLCLVKCSGELCEWLGLQDVTSDGKVQFSLVLYPKFANAKWNHPFHSADFLNLEQNVAFGFKKHLVHIQTAFEHKL